MEQLALFEAFAHQGKIDLYYGDESHVCSEGYVPYGWQFPDEEVYIASERSIKINCFGLISRSNQYYGFSSDTSITSNEVCVALDDFSWRIVRETVVVLDNASIHHAHIIKQRRAIWAERGLHIFYLPPYSPHLNIAEIVWRKLKGEWLHPQDYVEDESLRYAVNRCLQNIGTNLIINFSPFNIK